MDRLIYTAASGMSSAMIRQQLIAGNMANAHTTGFRADTLRMAPITVSGPQLEVRAMARAEKGGALMRAGSTISTGRDLDIACTGDVMLTLQAPDGGEGYTRRGDLSISPGGVLQNGDGLPVIGESGPISVPPGAKVTIAPDGAVMVSDPDTPQQPPQQVDRLKLANWRGSPIEKDASGLFRVPGDGVLPTDEDARIATGTLEQSNVDPTEILVEMVEAQRSFDIRAKLISTAKELDEGGASLMRINS